LNRLPGQFGGDTQTRGRPQPEYEDH